MDLTPDQLAAARACGCTLVPATDEQVRRLSVQRRIFRVGGEPVVATRGRGFCETWATLALLIESHRPVTPRQSGRTREAPPPEHATPVGTEPPPAPAKADTIGVDQHGRRGATAGEPRRPRTPRRAPAPVSADKVVSTERAAEPIEAEAVRAEVEAAAQGAGPRARGPGRRGRTGQPPTPRWMVAGKLRRGRLK